MRSTTPFRRAAGIVASAGLLAGGLLTLSGPAQAADPEFTIGGPAETALHPSPATGSPRKTSLDITVTNPSEDEENGDFAQEYTVRFDFGKLAGVADVSFGKEAGPDCERTGTTAVCHDYGIRPGLNTLAELRVSAAEGSEDGDSGTIEVTAEAEGATFRPFTAHVSIGGPDLSMKRLPLRTELKPGDSQPVPVTFTNNGTRAARGVLLTLRNTRGLEFTERYQNCEYSEEDLGMGPGAWSTALCTFPGSFEPGATYTLEVPPVLRATERALYDSFLYRINEDGTDARAALRSGARFSPGKGAELTLREAPAVRSADLDPTDNQQDADFRTTNTADFAAYGDKAAGKPGDTVDVTLGFRNKGPAWIGYIRSGEDVATVDFTVPHGSYVVSQPDACRGVTASGAYRENQEKAPRYFCSTPMSVLEDADFALPFRLKLVSADPGSKGAVVVRNTHLQAPALPFDPEPANNTASVELNGEDAHAATGGSDGGGSTATGGSGDTGGSGTTGATTGSGSSSSGTTGASGSGTTGSGSGGGALASTGTVALSASGAALVALAAGGVLVTVSRRRAAR
ncbi:peptidase [Streptomyces sp. SID9727]|uniref:peptidase n=1 Tax=Streptomyces sp. SID9727 TaxID=2706114 RepID=UPI0013C5E1B5|nr:peptidase [Streptomyces sp. SID9727]NEC63121.1 peptidase [Streptomyces sp. SID9727]